jgi:hypothetical protein
LVTPPFWYGPRNSEASQKKTTRKPANTIMTRIGM